MSSPQRPWSEARRARQAARIRQTRPWERATGPKTAAGKRRSAQNAAKHLMYSRTVGEIRALMRAWRHELHDLRENDW